MLGPVLEEIDKEFNDVTVGKLNVDENPQTAQEFQIMSIPLVILFKDGEAVESLLGLRPKQAYLDAIERHK
jgi:thioredoxin 1